MFFNVLSSNINSSGLIVQTGSQSCDCWLCQSGFPEAFTSAVRLVIVKLVIILSDELCMAGLAFNRSTELAKKVGSLQA